MSTQPRLAAPEHVDPLLGTTPGRSYESVVRELQEARADLARLEDKLATSHGLAFRLACDVDRLHAELDHVTRAYNAAHKALNAPVAEPPCSLAAAIARIPADCFFACGRGRESASEPLYGMLIFAPGAPDVEIGRGESDTSLLEAVTRAAREAAAHQGEQAASLVKPEQCCGGHADCAHVRQCRGDTA